MSSDLFTEIGIPVVVWLLMLVVGLELKIADFHRVLTLPKATIIATIGQIILLPLVTALLIWFLDPVVSISAGMILVAASPGGAISNVYTYLARANIALSVTLTAISTLVALFTLPLITTIGFDLFLSERTGIEVPIKQIVLQLLLMLVLPIVVGMGFNHFRPEVVDRYGVVLRQLSILAMILLVALILYQQRENLSEGVVEIVWIAVLFSTLAMSTGWAVGFFARLSPKDRFTLLIEFGARNLAITAVIGVMVFGQIDFVLFAAVFFLAQMPIALLLVKLFLAQNHTPVPKRAV